MVLYKLAVLGDGGVGKTALTIQFTLAQFVQNYEPTIEDSYRKQVEIDGEPCLMEITDTAGHEEYAALRDPWIRSVDGFVLVYSISSRSSFIHIQSLYDQIQGVKSLSAATASSIPMVLVGNMSDLAAREVSTQEGRKLARELGCEFLETSAKNYIRVEKVFHDVVRQLRRGSPQRGLAQIPAGRSGPSEKDDRYGGRGLIAPNTMESRNVWHKLGVWIGYFMLRRSFRRRKRSLSRKNRAC